MASGRAAVPARQLFNGFKASQRTTARCHARTMSTETTMPEGTVAKAYLDASLTSTPTEPVLKDEVTVPQMQSPASLARRASRRAVPGSFQAQRNPFLSNVQCTLHSFPSMEPNTHILYPCTHLAVPLRKDLLHRAVIYEGDNTRQGTASTKWRNEVHGSSRKIRPQKGTGRARLGDKKSPMLRGGGVAFGPKPRDFGTDLPEKIYDRAWRTALSYRYSRGELVVLDKQAEIDVHPNSRERYMRDVLHHNNMGSAGGRTLFVTMEVRKGLFEALNGDKMGRHARALDVTDVDVKDLLGMGRVVVEQQALDWMLQNHESDVDPSSQLQEWRRKEGL